MCSLLGIPKPELNQIKYQFISDNILMFTLYCSLTVLLGAVVLVYKVFVSKGNNSCVSVKNNLGC